MEKNKAVKENSPDLTVFFQMWYNRNKYMNKYSYDRERDILYYIVPENPGSFFRRILLNAKKLGAGPGKGGEAYGAV